MFLSPWFTASTTIVINAPPERVWDLLTRRADLPCWSTFLVGIDGPLVYGAAIVLRVRMDPTKTALLRVPERVIQVDPPRRLAWRYTGLPEWLHIAERTQTLEALDAGTRTRYTSVEPLSGILAPLIVLVYGRAIQAGFEREAHELKAAAERAGADKGR